MAFAERAHATEMTFALDANAASAIVGASADYTTTNSKPETDSSPMTVPSRVLTDFQGGSAACATPPALLPRLLNAVNFGSVTF